MARLTLHIALHLHEPAGTPVSRVAQAVAACYAPLIDLLEAHPVVDVAMHVGGYLLEWIERHDRALGDRLASLVSAGEVEIIGGGFYSPVLALLLWRDAIGQLEMTSGYLERRTGVRPTGAWLIEQVWMPRMAEILSDAGVQWTLIDQRALRSAGVEGEISGWYVTEHAARPLAVFPVDVDLRDRALQDGPDELIDYLRARLDQHGGDLTLTWAGDVQRLVAGAGRGLAWLDRLFTRAATESSWLHVVPPSHSLTASPARGRVYLPDSLHPDLVELTLQPSQVPTWRARRALDDAWLPGSVWQAFLARYGEADRLHKRMIEAARRFAAVERVMRNGGLRAMSQLTRPRRLLYRGQTGAAYGHGHAAGIHDPHLRADAYRNLIAAEVACDELVADPADLAEDRIEVGLRDLFADMTTSVLLRSRHLRVVVQPSRGGAIVGLEHIASSSALHDVLTRRAEAYHARGEQPIDGHDRAMFHDRLLTPDADTDGWMTDTAELGDLMTRSYRLLSVEDEGWGPDARVTVHLAGDGTLRLAGQEIAVAILKRTRVHANRADVEVSWSVEFDTPLPAPCDFGVECNLSSLGGTATATPISVHPDRRACGVATVSYESAGVRVELRPSGELVRLSHAAIITVARPVGGVCEPRFQGFSLLFRRSLAAGTAAFTCGLTLSAVGGSAPAQAPIGIGSR